jgi:hypothetical protein
MKRIDKSNWNGQSPMIDPPTIHYELAERTQAISAGGLGVVQQLVRQLEVAQSIHRGCPIFKFHLPYSEADHVLNIAYNLLAGGTCLEHLALRRSDEAYLTALGAQRMPNLVQIAENLPDSAWKELKRNQGRVNKPGQTRARRPNYKEQFVVKKGYTNKRLEQEFVAEFDDRPTAVSAAAPTASSSATSPPKPNSAAPSPSSKTATRSPSRRRRLRQ